MSGVVSRRVNNLHRNITVTPFLNKLYSMVDDGASDDLIRWSEDGNSFVVLKHEDFAKEVLPRFFKHSNFSSFVRQLNMYGFHKVPHLQQGGLITDGPNAESWEFSNANFQRGQPDLLHFIRRKKGNRDGTGADQEGTDSLTDEQDQQDADTNDSEDDVSPVAVTPRKTEKASGRQGNRKPIVSAGSTKTRTSRAPPADLTRILKEIQIIRDHQMTISTDIKRLQEENQSLWVQASVAEERYKKHQETIDKILRFLATVFSPDSRQVEHNPPLRRLISHIPENTIRGKGVRNSSEPGSSSSVLTQRQDSGNIYEDDDVDEDFISEQPPDKKMRTGSLNTSSRITEMPSPASPKATSAEQSTRGIKRKVSNPISTALTRTQPRPLNTNISMPNMNNASALVTSPGNPYSALRAQSKSLEQVQNEIDFLGTSLENLTRQLQYGPQMNNNNIAAVSSTGNIPLALASLPTSTAHLSTGALQQPLPAVPTSSKGVDLASIFSNDTLDNLALALSGASSLPTSAIAASANQAFAPENAILNGTSMASLGLTGNVPAAVPSANISGIPNSTASTTAAAGTYTGAGMNGVEKFDPSIWMEMINALTPEQYEYVQNYFRLVSGGNGVPLLTAANTNGIADSPEVAHETPFLDFVDPNAEAGLDSGLSSITPQTADTSNADMSDPAAIPSSTATADDYTQILLSALHSNTSTKSPITSGIPTSSGPQTSIDPDLTASLLGAISTAGSSDQNTPLTAIVGSMASPISGTNATTANVFPSMSAAEQRKKK